MSELPAPHTWKASAHDPLCRQQHWDGGDCFDCRLIAKVRADERERRTVNNPLLLADLRARVEALRTRQPSTGTVWVDRADVLALFDRSSDD